MRQIKYRGKFGNWWYVTPDDERWELFWQVVDKETIGQYIGLQDHSDSPREIYEGDILGERGGRAIVEFCDAYPEFGDSDDLRPAGFRLHRIRYENLAPYGVENIDEYADDWWGEPWIVIGNVHDNPELLEKVESEQE